MSAGRKPEKHATVRKVQQTESIYIVSSNVEVSKYWIKFLLFLKRCTSTFIGFDERVTAKDLHLHSQIVMCFP